MFLDATEYEGVAVLGFCATMLYLGLSSGNLMADQ